MAFSPDGAWFASSGRDNTARLWRVDRTKPNTLAVGPVLRHEDETNRSVKRVVFFSSSGKVATASGDNTAAVWNVEDGECIFQVRHQDFVEEVAVSTDGRFIGTASMDCTAAVWEVPSGQQRFQCTTVTLESQLRRRQLIPMTGN